VTTYHITDGSLSIQLKLSNQLCLLPPRAAPTPDARLLTSATFLSAASNIRPKRNFKIIFHQNTTTYSHRTILSLTPTPKRSSSRLVRQSRQHITAMYPNVASTSTLWKNFTYIAHQNIKTQDLRLTKSLAIVKTIPVPGMPITSRRRHSQLISTDKLIGTDNAGLE